MRTFVYLMYIQKECKFNKYLRSRSIPSRGRFRHFEMIEIYERVECDEN